MLFDMVVCCKPLRIGQQIEQLQEVDDAEDLRDERQGHAEVKGTKLRPASRCCLTCAALESHALLKMFVMLNDFS
jgi:hypothetical protein